MHPSSLSYAFITMLMHQKKKIKKNKRVGTLIQGGARRTAQLPVTVQTRQV